MRQASGDQADKIVVFGRVSCGFESSHGRPTSSLVSPVLAAAPILKNDIHCYFVNRKKVEREKDKKATYDKQKTGDKTSCNSYNCYHSYSVQHRSLESNIILL